MPSPESSHRDEILQKLEKAGETGLNQSKLQGARTSKSYDAKKQALHELLAKRDIGNLGTESKPRYVLIRFFNPLEKAYAAILKKATPGKVSTFLESELRKGSAGAIAAKVGEAIELLVAEKRLIRIKRGKSTFYLHAASIESLVNFGDSASGAGSQVEADGSPEASGTQLDIEALTVAYQELVRETGFSDVRISALQHRSGAPLAALKSWILAQSRAGKISPTRGDWSLADEAERAAAVEIAGEPHLRVRFLQA